MTRHPQRFRWLDVVSCAIHATVTADSGPAPRARNEERSDGKELS